MASPLKQYEEYKEHADDWLMQEFNEKRKIDLSPVYYHDNDRISNSLHVNVSLLKENKKIFDQEIPDHICAMMQEALRENILLLVEKPEKFIDTRQNTKFFRTEDDHSTRDTLCKRGSKKHGKYLEVRAADAETDPYAAETVALLGVYLGLKHPEAKQINTGVEMPRNIQTSVYWFLRGNLLRDTLDILSTRYGEELGIPPRLGTLIHHTILDQHEKDMPNHEEKLKINTAPITNYQRRGLSLI